MIRKEKKTENHPQNKLRDYLENNGIYQTWFARQVGITQTNLNHILTGKSLPRLRTAMEIERVSKGNVTVYDLVPKDEDTKKEVKPIKKKRKDPPVTK